jgi:RND family efflux transporter MFP subunit
MVRCFGVASIAVWLAASACGKREQGIDPDKLLGEPVAAASDVAGSLVPATSGAAADALLDVVTGTGTLFPAQETNVMAEVPGRVLQLFVEEGDIVPAGGPLAELDPIDFNLALQQAQLNLRLAELGVRNSRQDFERAKELQAQGVLAQAAFDGAQVKYDLSSTQLSLARTVVAQVERKLSQLKITAPYEALVVNRLVSAGAVIQAMPPTVLFRLQDVRNLRLKVKVPELAMRSVAVGDRVEARFAGLGRTIEAAVSAVIASVDPMSRTFDVVAAIDNGRYEMALRPGMFADVRILHSAGPAGTPRAEAFGDAGPADGAAVEEVGASVDAAASVRDAAAER